MVGARDFVGRDEYVPPYMCRIDQEGIEYGNKEDKSIQRRPHQIEQDIYYSNSIIVLVRVSPIYSEIVSRISNHAHLSYHSSASSVLGPVP
jgi:hypothetical protein